MTTKTLTAADYERAFEAERANEYSAVNAFEQRVGHAIDREKLETAARVLACPVKDNSPNWQHGRVIYALTKDYTARNANRAMFDGPFRFLDIGTAKGFSALCLLWGVAEHCAVFINSVDVIDPSARTRRNTVAEVDELKTLFDILKPWPEAQVIQFHKSTGQKWLQEHTERIHVAFIDGKHSYEAVSWEVALLAERQRSGDVAMFDDVQIAGVAKALKESKAYEFEYLQVKADRIYAIGTRK